MALFQAGPQVGQKCEQAGSLHLDAHTALSLGLLVCSPTCRNRRPRSGARRRALCTCPRNQQQICRNLLRTRNVSRRRGPCSARCLPGEGREEGSVVHISRPPPVSSFYLRASQNTGVKHTRVHLLERVSHNRAPHRCWVRVRVGVSALTARIARLVTAHTCRFLQRRACRSQDLRSVLAEAAASQGGSQVGLLQTFLKAELRRWLQLRRIKKKQHAHARYEGG